MSFDSPLYHAIIYASRIYGDLKKKGSGEPFSAHCFSVALHLVKEGADDETVIAGLLHDAIEKAGATAEEINRLFGGRVTRIVVACTEPPDADSYYRRKQGILDALRTAEPDAQMVMIADKLYNLTALIDAYRQRGETVWDAYEDGKKGRLWYFKEIKHIAEDIEAQGVSHSLFREYLKKHEEFMSGINETESQREAGV